jgi:hypothetical protein
MAAPIPGYVYAAKYLSAIDGDTYKFLIDLGCDDLTKQALRLNGYSAVELSQPGGLEAKAEADRILSAATFIVVQLFRTRTTDQNDPNFRRTFARFVADIWVDDVPMYEAMGTFVHVGTKEGIIPNRLPSQWEIGGYK